MTLIIQPLQPFVVQPSPSLTPLQYQALIHLYQPLIGASGVALYVSLNHIPIRTKGFTRRLLHAQFIQTLDMGIHDFDLSRKKLEACGLLKTFRQQDPKIHWQKQTLLYTLQLPLDVGQFVAHPLLNATLLRKLGQEYYDEVLEQFEVEAVDLSSFMEVTTDFGQIFNNDLGEVMKPHEEAIYASQLADGEVPLASADFSYERLLAYLEAEHIPPQTWTEELKEEVFALYRLYRLSEEEVAEVIKLAYNSSTQRIRLDRFNEIAGKRAFYQREANKQPQVDESIQKESLAKEFPMLDEEDLDLVYHCYRYPVRAFLEMTKRAVGGFATDSERYFVQELKERSTLGRAIVNYMTYYLLVIESRPNLYKGELQRLANQWQQQQLKDIPAVMTWLEEEKRKKADKQQAGNFYKKPTYEEPIPEWLTEELGEARKPAEEQVAGQSDAQDIKARLNRLMDREGD